MTGRYEEIGADVGRLVDKKNRAYGDSFRKGGTFLSLLYPHGVRPVEPARLADGYRGLAARVLHDVLVREGHA